MIHRLAKDVHELVVERIDAGEGFALVTVLSAAGSTPRKAGTRAVVDADGTLWGTVGGGLLEAEARRLAGEAIRCGRVTLLAFRFAGDSTAGDQGVCGGTMRLLIDPTVARQREAHAAAADALRRRERGILLTVVDENEAPAVRTRWLGPGAAGDGMPQAAARAVELAVERASAEPFASADGRTSGLAELVVPAPLLLIAGGGHVGQALAEQAILVGFEVVVVEDRAEFADAGRYPPGVTTRCGRFADVLGEFPVTPDTFIAILGRGHRADGAALAACIGRPAAYIGMMGSRRKVALMRRQFLAEGLATAEQFDRVCAPIGIDIGAETVPEIAASIAAQLIAARRGARAPVPREGER